MMYRCNDSNDLFHTSLTLTCPSAYYMLYRNSQYIAILWVQYINMAKYSIVTALTWSSSIYTWLHGAVCVCWNFLLPRPLWSPQSLCTLLQLPAWLTSTYFTLSCCILLIATADTADTAGTAITSLTKQPYFIEHTLHISISMIC